MLFPDRSGDWLRERREPGQMRTHPLDGVSSGALRSRLSAGGCEGPALTVEEGEEMKTESQPSSKRGERDREREKEKDKEDKQTIIR